MLNDTSIKELGASLRGRVIEPQDAGYDDARRVYNGMINKRPRLIARCADVACKGQPGCGCTGAEICDNGADDDCNGAIDCADGACIPLPVCLCSGRPEICGSLGGFASSADCCPS